MLRCDFKNLLWSFLHSTATKKCVAAIFLSGELHAFLLNDSDVGHQHAKIIAMNFVPNIMWILMGIFYIMILFCDEFDTEFGIASNLLIWYMGGTHDSLFNNSRIWYTICQQKTMKQNVRVCSKNSNCNLKLNQKNRPAQTQHLDPNWHFISSVSELPKVWTLLVSYGPSTSCGATCPDFGAPDSTTTAAGAQSGTCAGSMETMLKFFSFMCVLWSMCRFWWTRPIFLLWDADRSKRYTAGSFHQISYVEGAEWGKLWSQISSRLGIHSGIRTWVVRFANLIQVMHIIFSCSYHSIT